MKNIKQLVVLSIFYVGDTVCRTNFVNTKIGFSIFFWSMMESLRLQDKWKLRWPWYDNDNNGKTADRY